MLTVLLLNATTVVATPALRPLGAHLPHPRQHRNQISTLLLLLFVLLELIFLTLDNTETRHRRCYSYSSSSWSSSSSPSTTQKPDIDAATPALRPLGAHLPHPRQHRNQISTLLLLLFVLLELIFLTLDNTETRYRRCYSTLFERSCCKTTVRMRCRSRRRRRRQHRLQPQACCCGSMYLPFHSPARTPSTILLLLLLFLLVQKKASLYPVSVVATYA